MTLSSIKKVPVYDIKIGTVLDHNLYGKGKVINASDYGYVNLQFSDGYIEENYDVRSQVAPSKILTIESFKCPITNMEVTADQCASAVNGIHACKYHSISLNKQAQCDCRKEETVKAMNDMMTKTLKDTKIEDIFSIDKTSNVETAVRHLVTGAKGNIEKQVSDNAVLVEWKNQECPCKTVVTTTEIEKDNDALIVEKFKKLQEKFKKKFVKPINDFFKNKKASEQVEETFKIDADKIINKITAMSTLKKAQYVQAMQSQLNSCGIDIDAQSIELNDKGEATKYNVIKCANDMLIEELPIKEANELLKPLGYEGDILKIYASIKAQVAPHTEGYKKEYIEDYTKDADLNGLF